jgi:serine/threonine protein kinase
LASAGKLDSYASRPVLRCKRQEFSTLNSGVDAILKQRGSLAAAIVATIGLQVISGLDDGQKNQLIHRDIKPSNLFVTLYRIVKIMNFGLVKRVGEFRWRRTAGASQITRLKRAVKRLVERPARQKLAFAPACAGARRVFAPLMPIFHLSDSVGADWPLWYR